MLSDRPPKFRDVKVGDVLYVKEEYLFMGGKEGIVVDIFDDDGCCALDFHTDRNGGFDGPSIECWDWGELENSAYDEEAGREAINE